MLIVVEVEDCEWYFFNLYFKSILINEIWLINKCSLRDENIYINKFLW